MNTKTFVLILCAIFLICLMSGTFALSTSDITAYYKLDETTGTLVTDSNGSNNGSNSFATINQIGKIGTAYDFNYIKRVILPNESNFDYLTAVNGNWTISFWEKPSNSRNGDQTVFSKQISATDTGIYLKQRDADANKLNFTLGTNASNLKYYVANTTTPVRDGSWYFIVIRSTNGVINIKVNDINQSMSTGVIGTFSGANVVTPFHINTQDTNLNGFDGILDEFGIWNKALSDAELTLLYNAGAGLTFPFGATVNSSFTYSIEKQNSKIVLINTSTTYGTTIQDSTWIVNGYLEQHTNSKSDYNHSATQLTDYNICLIVADKNIPANSSSSCQQFNTGDWEPPTTSFTSSQYAGTTINKLTFVCTDNNSGCKWLTYKIDNNSLWTTIINTGTKDINYLGGGDHNVQYYSTDNSDNNETTKNASFTTYGRIEFNIYDENTGLALTGASIDYNGTPQILTGNTWSQTLQGTPTSSITYTITKTNYGIRHYELNLNEFTDVNVSFALLSSTLGQDVSLTAFSPTLALLPNTYVEFYKPDKSNMTVERILTDSQGQATINLSLTDTNYWVNVNAGAYTYKPVLLTINKPKLELTGVDLNTTLNPFNVTITGPNYGTYTNRTSAVTAYLLTNTTNPYNIAVSDSNGSYYPRTFQLTFPGNPGTYSLTPYLLSYVNGISVKVATFKQNSLVVTPYPSVTYSSYKDTGFGKILIETRVTDAKGEALSIMNPGDTYTFNVWTLDLNNVNQPIQFNGSVDVPIKVTGSTVALIITTTAGLTSDTNSYGYIPNYSEQFLTMKSLGLTDINFTLNNVGESYYFLTYWFDINGTQIGPDWDTFVYVNDLNKVYDANLDWSLVPSTATSVNLNLTLIDFDSQTSIHYSKVYAIAPNGSVDIVNLFRNDVRNEIFGCTKGQSCLGSGIGWFLISLLLMVLLYVRAGFSAVVNPFSFTLLMAIGTFLNWVPSEITAVIAIGAIGLYLLERR